MNGAQILLESLRKAGTEVIFGYPGGQALPIFDKLYDFPLKFILVRHEQAAAHAADGYSRATGKVGVCLATSGPGATNLITGIATAYMDSIPMVAITGQVKTSLIGNDAFQEADVTGITRPITKHNYLVKDAKDIARTVAEAFYIASSGRPGPVLIDLPSDVQLQEAEFVWPETVELRSYKPTLYGHPGQIKKAVHMISQAKKPVIYAGGGVITAGAFGELREFAEKINAPVTVTLMGMGAFPADSPLFLGMLGMHGTAYANHAITESDLIIAVGARFDDRVTGKIDAFAPEARIIHIDIDPSSIGKNVRVDIPIVGDARNVLGQILEEIKKLPNTEAWMKNVAALKKKFPLRYSQKDRINPQYVIEQICDITGSDAVVATEVGQHQMWAAQWFKYLHPRTFISSGVRYDGFRFSAAMGAQIGCRTRSFSTSPGTVPYR
jgi:acetolactate synthase-1/2/3 large subunit